MKNKVLLIFIVSFLFSCSSGDSISQRIMVKHQYQQVGFDSPGLFYSADSNFVIVKKQKNEKRMNFLVMDLKEYRILYQKKIKNGDVSWKNKNVFQICIFRDKSKLDTVKVIRYKIDSDKFISKVN